MCYLKTNTMIFADYIFSNDIDNSIRKIISFTNCTEEETYHYVIREQKSLEKMQELSGLKVNADYKPSQYQTPNQVICPFVNQVTYIKYLVQNVRYP